MLRIVCILIGYIFGLFQTGYIYGRLNHVDIREHGSGNAGTTNAMRVLGKKAGIITYIGDALKAVAAGFVIRLLFADSDINIIVLILYSGIGVVLGHNFPFYMNFKGGKGVAASSGVIVSILDWRLIVIGLSLFIGITIITRYVSLASLSLMTSFFILFVIFSNYGIIEITNKYKLESYILVLIIALLAFFQHRANIARLIKGTESKLGQKKDG